MRLIPLLVASTLLLALASLAPAAAAASQRCSSLVDPACPGLHCVDENGDRRFDERECTRVPGVCEFQSDCCGWTGGFWCPDRE